MKFMVIECIKNELKMWINSTIVIYIFENPASQVQTEMQAESSEKEFSKTKLTSTITIENN